MHTIAENRLAKFEYDPDKKLVISTYKGIFKYDLAKEIYNSIGQEVSIVGKIADVRKLNGSFVKLMQEFKEKYPVLKKRGLKAEVFVVSDDLMVNNLINKLCKQLEAMGINTHTCNSLEEANEWLNKYLDE